MLIAASANRAVIAHTVGADLTSRSLERKRGDSTPDRDAWHRLCPASQLYKRTAPGERALD